MSSTIDRRAFLTRAGLTLAIVATPSSLKVLAMGPAATASDVFSPGPWLQITPDNQVTVLLCKSEMGQGIHTAIPMIVADELDVKWEQVRIEQAPTRKQYYSPGPRSSYGTGGSSGVRTMYDPLRQAAAAGREMLVQAGAEKWSVPVSECQASEGSVHHRPSGRSIAYGELVEEASKLPVPENPRLKDKSEFWNGGAPGITNACVDWIADKDIAMLATDNIAVEVEPPALDQTTTTRPSGSRAINSDSWEDEYF